MRKNLKNKSAARRRAFTLMELLAVITIIGVLAAFLLTVSGSVKKRQYISHAQAELGLVDFAIKQYYDSYRFYPPGNPGNALTNQLYYELEGTVTNATGFQTLDGDSAITAATVSGVFGGIGGFINCTKGSGDDASPAKNFLASLKPGQKATDGNVVVLVGSMGGPEATYQPMSGFTSGTGGKANPFRYLSPGVYNPGSFDLWIQLQIGGKKYLVCNWSKQVQPNSPLP